MTPVPLFTLFALKALLNLEATNSNNVKGGTMLAEARSAWWVPFDEGHLHLHPMWPWGVLGLEIGGRSDRGVMVTVYLSGADPGEADGVCLLLADRGADVEERELLEAADWLAGFRESTRPFEVGERWWIDPHPEKPTAAPPGRQRLVIEPTGSGILALAADHLGADTVIALDIDETAIWVASETARQQDWTSRVTYVLGPVGCIGRAEFDIVMCNMVTSIFLPLVSELRSALAPAGIVVFSGLLASEVKSVSGALVEAGFAIRSHRILGEWAGLVAIAEKLP
jgi:ribosomal protein L11 methyltransferase